MIKGVIFDVDGVIIDTENTHFLAFQKVFKNHGHNLSQEEYKTHFSGKSIKGGVLSLLSKTSLLGSFNTDDFIQTITEEKITKTLEIIKQKVVYFENTIKFIHKIAEGNITLLGLGKIDKKPILAMATGLEAVYFEYVLASHNLKKLFSVLVTADQYTHSKPNPECYLSALKKMNLAANEVIGIEDSVSGVKALNAAKIKSIAVTNTYEKSELNEASIVVNNLTELILN